MIKCLSETHQLYCELIISHFKGRPSTAVAWHGALNEFLDGGGAQYPAPGICYFHRMEAKALAEEKKEKKYMPSKKWKKGNKK